MQLAPEPQPTPSRRWGAILAACIALPVGGVLAIYPWAEGWDANSLQELDPTLGFLWLETWFRGAISFLGVANVLIALSETLRALRRPL